MLTNEQLDKIRRTNEYFAQPEHVSSPHAESWRRQLEADPLRRNDRLLGSMLVEAESAVEHARAALHEAKDSSGKQ